MKERQGPMARVAIKRNYNMRLFTDIKSHIALLLAAASSVCVTPSCTQHPTAALDKDKGVLLIESIRKDVSVIERTTYADAADSYRVTITDSKGVDVMSFEDSNDMPEAVELDYGTYTLTATSGQDMESGWESPYLVGTRKFKIKTGELTTVSPVCSLANVKVSVVFDESLADNFSHIEASVTNNASDNAALTFTTDENRQAYFKATGSLSWVLDLTNTQGATYRIRKTITGVKPREHYTFRFKVSDTGEITDGGIHTSVNVDATTGDIDHEIVLVPCDAPMGSFASDDINMDSPTDIWSEVVTPVRVNIESPAGIDLLYITHCDPTLSQQGIAEFTNLTTADDDKIAALNAAGITWGGIGTTSGFVDFTGMTSKMKTGEHIITLMLLDNHSRFVEQEVIFNVRSSKADTETKSVEAFATYAHIEAAWISEEQPEGLAIEYRKESDSQWTQCPDDEIAMNGTDFKTTLHGLDPDTRYKVRARSALIEGNELTFTTESKHYIPNLNMDAWSQSGKTWNPWGGDVSQFWDTGNSGVTIVTNSNTVPVDEPEAYRGRGVKMTSMWVGVPANTFAAGNLFTGYFKTNMSNPKASVHFGRPFTGRPSGLRFHYKYTSTTINRGGSHQGEADRMHVYISLENWGDPNLTERPSNPTVVGYGEFKSADNKDEYTEAGFDIEYTLAKDGNDNTIKPTHIVMVATSSVYGSDFIGGEGSTLYIDEFEMLY